MTKTAIQTLIDSGTMKLYHDYRSGSAYDWSGNGHHGALTDVYWTNNGFKKSDVSTGKITISASLDFIAPFGTLIFYLDSSFNECESAGTKLFESTPDGISYEWNVYYDKSTNRLYLSNDMDSAYITPVANAKCHVLSFADSDLVHYYADGVYVGTLSGGGFQVPMFVPTDIVIGSAYINPETYGSVISAVIYCDTQISATEISQICGELGEKIWPKTVEKNSSVVLQPDYSDPTLLSAWNMKPKGSTVIDNGIAHNTGTITNATTELTPFGPAMEFRGGSNVSFINLGDLATYKRDSFTISYWMYNPVSVSTTEGVFSSGYGQYFVGNASPNGLYFRTNNAAGASKGTFGVTELLSPGKWHFVVFTVYTSGSNVYKRGYINGVLTLTADYTDGWYATYGTAFRIGTFSSGSFAFLGKLADFRFYSDAKDQAWVTKEFNKGKDVAWKSGFGAKTSSSAEAGKYLSNTPFKINSGTWKVSMDTINSTPVKIIECITAGEVYVPYSVLNDTSAQSAYGEWEFYLYTTSGNTPRVTFISSAKDGNTSGYYFAVDTANGKCLEYELGVGQKFDGANSSYSLDTWHKIRITRSYAGIFTTYVDDVLATAATGTNPWTDTTTKTSEYFVLVLDAGDKVSLGSVDGKYNIIKRLM